MSVKQIDRYEILAEIGHGGMATVYHAHSPDGEDVAVKVLRREYLTDLGLRARFEREAQTVAALKHPAILPLLAFGQHREHLYLAMPYMPGGSLALRLQQGTLSPQEASAILSRIASALDHAHAQGLVHRDLKPSNILFDAEDQAHLADFGIALQTTAGSVGHAVIDGTPAYMSPEQCRPDADIDERSDVYSLGATLTQMLTGRPPFSGDTPLAILAQHVHHSPPALLSLNPNLPATLEPVINKALAKEPAARYQTAGALATAYHQALASPVAESEAAKALPGDPVAPAVEQPAAETLPDISGSPAEAATPIDSLHARAPRLADGARRWLDRHFVTALALVSLLGVLCAATAVMAIRVPAALQAWGARADTSPSPTTAAFLPFVGIDDTDAEAAAPPTDATPIPAPNLLLLYSTQGITAINASDETLSLNGVIFRRPAADGSGAAVFAANEWRGVAGRAISALSPRDCLQLLHLDGSSPNPEAPQGCNTLRGWLATRRQERLFFLPAPDVNAFEVLRGEQLIGRCTIADEECRLHIPRP